MNGLSNHLHFSAKNDLRPSVQVHDLTAYSYLSTTKKQAIHSAVQLLSRTPFSNYVRMRTGSLVARPQITAFWLGIRPHVAREHEYVRNVSSQSLPGPRAEDDTQRY